MIRSYTLSDTLGQLLDTDLKVMVGLSAVGIAFHPKLISVKFLLFFYWVSLVSSVYLKVFRTF